MGAEEYLVHRHHCAVIPKDNLDVWRPVTANDLPAIQINQSNGVTASVNYDADEALTIARAILEAAGLNAKITVQ